MAEQLFRKQYIRIRFPVMAPIMKIPFSFRKVTPYEFDGDGRFPTNRIVGKDKKRLKKKQIKKYLGLTGKDWH